MSLLTPPRNALVLPGSSKRLLRGPDARGLLNIGPSAAPITNDEVDYDELDVIRAWRVYADDAPGEVKYFCYELTQKDPFKPSETYFKVVRLARLTRVPRYLRNTGGGGSGQLFSQMRDVLVGLREKRILFLNVVAKSPVLPLIFAYGVQGTGDTLSEAMMVSDEAFAALTFNLDGTYQQLEYKPLKFEEAENLARYQAEWNHVAMARGRPMPQGVALGSSSILDGNRTDAENTNNQLESFIRGMSDKPFMLSLVTVPLAPQDMTLAWRNITEKLSAARSDQSGSRGVAAGVALPLGMGMSNAEGSGTSQGVTSTTGTGMSDGVSQSLSQGLALSTTDSTGQAFTQVSSDSISAAEGLSQSSGTSLGQSTTATEGVSSSVGQSGTFSESQGQSEAGSVNQVVGSNEAVSTQQGVSRADSVTQSLGVTESSGITQGQSFSQGVGVSQGQTLTDAVSAGSNWSNGASQSATAGQTLGGSWSQSAGETLAQGFNIGNTNTDGTNTSLNTGETLGTNAGIAGFAGIAGSETTTSGQGFTDTFAQNLGLNQTGSGSNSLTSGQSLGNSLSGTQGLSESAGGNFSRSASEAASVSQSENLVYGQTLAATQMSSVSQSLSQGTTMGQSLSSGYSQGLSQATGVGSSAGINSGQSVAASQSAGMGTSNALASGSSLSQNISDGRSTSVGTSQALATGNTVSSTHSEGSTTSQTNSSGTSAALSKQQALSDAWSVAMSRQATQTGSLGIVPTFTAQFSKNTYDESKRMVGDLLQAQADRYMDGIEGGALLYQMFLVTPDRETLSGASTLLKSAFWGPGGDAKRLTAPFHTVIIDDEDERRRILSHASAFSSYRKREPNSDLVEPYLYSSFVTTGEASTLCHPPTSEALGLQAQVDSMPIMAMPDSRSDRDLYLGHIINGERARVTDARFGIDLNELTHVLIQGVTGLGKTTTAMRLMEQAVRMDKQIVSTPTVENPMVEVKNARAGLLVLDWMQNARNLASVVEPERFQLFSVSHPELGAFRFNPLAVPHAKMDPGQWSGAQADNLASSFGLGQYGRSIISELLDFLYTANRLEETVLRPAVLDDYTGEILRNSLILPAISRSDLPEDAVQYDASGKPYANVYTHSPLSRLVGLTHLAVLVSSKVEEAASQEGGRMMGTEMRNRLQSVWRRIQYYTPGNPLANMVTPDPGLDIRECLGVTDLIDPDRGLVTVIETDGLDVENRRVVLGSVMLAVYRYGLQEGNGCYDHGGKGPGTFIVLEEAHELLGEAGETEDRDSAGMRTALYESLFRRARATGLRLVVMTQNCGQIPSAITSQTTTVFTHRTYDDKDRQRIFSLLNWSNMIGQQQREWRYLGEMPRGYCIVRLDAKDNYLDSAPAQILIDPPSLPEVTEAQLISLAEGAKTLRLSR